MEQMTGWLCLFRKLHRTVVKPWWKTLQHLTALLPKEVTSSWIWLI